jgi:hypothetical protein
VNGKQSAELATNSRDLTEKDGVMGCILGLRGVSGLRFGKRNGQNVALGRENWTADLTCCAQKRREILNKASLAFTSKALSIINRRHFFRSIEKRAGPSVP